MREILKRHPELADFLSGIPTVLYTLRRGDSALEPEAVTHNIEPLLGYTIAEALQPDWWSAHLHPDDRAHAMRAFAAIETEDRLSHEYRFLRRDGATVWILDRMQVKRREGGVAVEVHGAWIEITARKLAELRLAESEQRYRTLFDASGVPTLVSDPRTRQIVDANPAACAFYGWDRDTLLRMKITDINTARLDALLDAIHDGWKGRFDFQHHLASGEVREVEVFSRGATLDGRVVAISTILDVTARHKAEREVAASEAKFRQLAEGAVLGVFVIEGDALSYVNPSFARIFGYTPDEMIRTLPMGELIHPEDRAEAFTQVHARLGGAREPVSRAWRGLRKDGTEVWFEVYGQPVEIHGRPAVQGTLVDVTEKRRLEAQLWQAQKMESVGRLAGGVAHDSNNMLGVILGNAEMALAEPSLDGALRQSLVEIREAATRSAALTQQLLGFARRQPIVPVVLDLNRAVGNALSMLQRLIGENIALTWKPGAGLWRVKLDPSQIDQILTNLCVNAREAIEDVGAVTIQTENVVLGGAERVSAPPGEYVRLTVRDNGCGMTEAVRAKVFEPFFTTKAFGKGTGLGLATVYGIVKQNHGSIDIESQPGRGTTITVCVPRYVEGAERVAPEAPRAEAPRNAGTVLLVEDEAALLRLTKRMLERAGYTVMSAGAPMQALRLVQEHPGRIDLLVTDVVMPEMNGRELSHSLRALRPGLRCVYISGHSADVITDHGELEAGSYFLQKPFSLAEITAAVRLAMDGAPAA